MALSIDVSGFTGAMDAAGRYVAAGQFTERAVNGELGKVLQRAVDYTHAPDKAWFRQQVEWRMRRSFNTYAEGEDGRHARDLLPRVSITPGTANEWWVDNNKNGQKTFYIMNRGPRANWGDRWVRFQAENRDRLNDLASELMTYLPKIIGSRGLTKQSWVQIGNALDIEIPGVPGYVRAAAPSNGRTYVNGSGTRSNSADRLVITLENMMPTLVSPRRSQEGLEGARVLQSAFDSRDKAIMTAIEKGIFDDLDAALKRFPGISLMMR